MIEERDEEVRIVVRKVEVKVCDMCKQDIKGKHLEISWGMRTDSGAYEVRRAQFCEIHELEFHVIDETAYFERTRR